MKPHRGIRIDSIPVKGSPGLIFAIGVLAILLIGVPATREFAILALIAGLIVAGFLYWWHNPQPRDLSSEGTSQRPRRQSFRLLAAFSRHVHAISETHTSRKTAALRPRILRVEPASQNRAKSATDGA